MTVEEATFAGGCFWCMEAAFGIKEGVVEVTPGYTGGELEFPTYEQVSTGETGHYEAINVKYDPSVVSYQRLLELFWRNIDPTDEGGQFADRGPQYRTAIFYHNDEQKRLAEESKKKLEESGKFDKPIATNILKFDAFYKAEDYHKDYYKKNADDYKTYKKASGREDYIKQKWKDDKKLTPMQYRVTQLCDTEPPFENEYWDNKREGIYVDIVSGEPLFSSKDKFDSGTGWPSFTRTIEDNVVFKEDRSAGMVRTEVKSKKGGTHLGHVFDDGPAPTGKRFCMNSCALRFIPKEGLEKEGYKKYKELFN